MKQDLTDGPSGQTTLSSDIGLPAAIPPRTPEQERIQQQLEAALLGRKNRQVPLVPLAPPAGIKVTNPATAAVAKVLSPAFTSGVCVYCGDPAEMVCDACEAQIDVDNDKAAADLEREKERSRREWFLEKIPEEYRRTDDLLMPQWSREILACWNPLDRYGVTIVGPSDNHKTRTAIKLLEKAYLRGISVEYRQAGDLRREINKAAREGEDGKLLAEIASVPLLVLDDLGNQAWTDSSEEAFLSIVEARSNSRVKTIVTSQFPSDEFVARLTVRRRGHAIARRIGPDFNWIIDTVTGTITPPNQFDSPR